MKVYVNKNLRELRLQTGMSQGDFANELGISRSSLGSYEEERAQVPLPVAAKAMELFDIPKEEFHEFIFNKDYI